MLLPSFMDCKELALIFEKKKKPREMNNKRLKTDNWKMTVKKKKVYLVEKRKLDATKKLNQ